MKTINKCILYKHQSILRKTTHVLLHVGQTKARLLFMYIKVSKEKHNVDNFLCAMCCSSIVENTVQYGAKL